MSISRASDANRLSISATPLQRCQTPLTLWQNCCYFFFIFGEWLFIPSNVRSRYSTPKSHIKQNIDSEYRIMKNSRKAMSVFRDPKITPIVVKFQMQICSFIVMSLWNSNGLEIYYISHCIFHSVFFRLCFTERPNFWIWHLRPICLTWITEHAHFAFLVFLFAYYT